MKTRIITLLIAIVAIVGNITALESNRVIKLYKDGEVIKKYNLSELDSVRFEKRSSGENPSVDLHNGHEYVDLGLPSGLKWATCNVGATTPEGYGDYFAWGETEPKATYDVSTYKYCNGTIDSFTKYCTESDLGFDFGTEDNKTMLELSDDAARVNWGGDWRMPTGDEMEELMDTNNCTWEWTTQNGVNGYKVTSNKNGNSIFLPAAGERYNYDLNNAGSNGYYWSSSLVASYCQCANYILFDSGSVGLYDSGRISGQSVRAVFGEKQSFTVSVSAGTGGSATASALEVEQGGSVTLTATANSGYVFKNWTLGGEVVSTENPYTVTVNANSEFVANFEEVESSGEFHNGHEYVDLGLPSGLKWATCNVGATTPEEYGNYYAWGEITTKEVYSSETYTYTSTPTRLPLSADAANVNWGGKWRMPTGDEMEELIDSNNCTWEWTTQNGVNGYLVTSNNNGNSIFLPAAGERQNYDLDNEGSNGYYWSSSLDTSMSGRSLYLSFADYSIHIGSLFCKLGMPVRAVYEASYIEPEMYSVSVSSTEGGTATVSASSVEQGGSVTLTATANSYCEFVNWTLNGEVVSTENPYTTTITANSEFVANFVEFGTACLWYYISNDYSGSGYIEATLTSTGETLSSGRVFLAGSEVTLTATPYSDEDVFIRWELHKPNDEIIVITENPCTITVTEDSYIDAVFYSDPVSLSIVAEGGTITGGETLIELYDSVDLTATPNDGYAFENWTIDGEVVSTQKNYSFMILEDMEIKANFIEYKKTGTHNNHDYVDLGLPSGTKWATYSVGATIPDENGYYFAWGETEPKDIYTYDNHKYYDGEGWDGAIWSYFYSKYNDDDDIYELESIDDAARVNWGDGWRMPTSDEMKELCNRDNCIWTLTKINEVYVYKVTSKTNGNYIFFSYIEGKGVIDENGRLTCAFWSKDRRSTYGETVVMSSDGGTSTYARYRGLQVRAVCTKGGNDEDKGNCTITVSSNIGGTATASSSIVAYGNSVTLIATPDEGYAFKNWISSGEIFSTENPYTTLPLKGDITFVANFEYANAATGINNGKGYVDLGLPSGLKWATCNVGATTLESYGNYYAWGEITTKDSYTLGNYTYTDTPATLPLSADAANANWGSNWRMPTVEEVQELIDNCTVQWTIINGVGGYKMVSKTNGNYIFLPAAGLFGFGQEIYGYYWTSSYNSNYLNPYYMTFGKSSGISSTSNYTDYPSDGRSVRAVCE